MRRAIKLGVIVLGALTALTAVVHIPFVQRQLGGCPFGHDKVATTARRGDPGLAAAKARPALAFALDTSTRSDVWRWAMTNRVACADQRRGQMIECRDVPGQALGTGALTATSLWIELDASGRVIGVKTVRRTDAASPVAEAFRATTAIASTAGDAVATHGDPDAIARGAFHQAAAEYRFRDYLAMVRATNMGDGFVLTESYASAMP